MYVYKISRNISRERMNSERIVKAEQDVFNLHLGDIHVIKMI
jgi:hypothetical protein